MNRKFVSLMVAAALLATSALPVMADDKKDNDRADVTLTMTSGNEFFTANNDEVMVMKELSVPYFDLELYGMEDYYYNPDCYDGITDPNDIDTPKNPGTKETAEGNVTLLHALIYATEIYQLQLPEEGHIGMDRWLCTEEDPQEYAAKIAHLQEFYRLYLQQEGI